MRILVVGAGAIGGIIGGYLTRAGEDVLLVDQVDEHVRAMQQSGLLIDGIPGELRIAVQATTPAELTGEYDVVLIAVPSQHTAGALEHLTPHVAADGMVVSVQNGLGNKDLVAASVGRERTLGAMVRLSGGYRGPGHVSHITEGLFVVGELDGRLTPRLETLHRLLERVAPTQSTDNLFGWLWAKETYGCLVVASALVDGTMAEMLALPQAREIVTQAMRECALVARAEGVHLEAFDFLDPNALLGSDPADQDRVEQDLDTINSRFGHTKGGVWRDIAVRRIPTEVPFTVGEVVRRGKRVGVPTPVLTRLTQMIAEIEGGERQMSPENVTQLATLL